MAKLFWDIREEHELMEKLRASDPTGKWISDFVHSDNPKFAGKSKKERIRMALGASYAAKRQNEDVDIDEAAWGQDKMANLKAAHDRHSEKAIAANRAGDDEAVKVHQSKMNMIKNQMNKLRKEEVEQVDELRTSTLLRYATKANKSLIGGDRNKEEKRIKGIQKANYKIQTRHRVEEDAEQIDELSSATLKSYIGKATRSIEQKKKDVGKYDRFSKDPRRGPVAKSINAKISSRIGQEAKRRATNIGKAAMKLASEESVNETPAYTKDDAYSSFGSIKPHRTLKVANVLKPEKDATARAERLMSKAGVRTNEAKSLYDRHQELRKKSGLPDPSYYLKRMKEKQAEIEALRNQGSTDHLHGISHDAHPGAQKTFAGQIKK